jgi:peptidoglycan/xylan/chitin deacetylase (PgdA/CDA1 family)
MGEQDVVSLGSEFEVGAHTLNHVVLTRTDANIARHEIEESKSWLELLLGKECEVFCFPQGKFDSEHMGSKALERLNSWHPAFRLRILDWSCYRLPFRQWITTTLRI